MSLYWIRKALNTFKKQQQQQQQLSENVMIIKKHKDTVYSLEW